MLGAEGLDLALREVGVLLDLIDSGDDRGAVEQRGEVVDHEVADADRADLAVGQQRLERPVGLERPVEGAAAAPGGGSAGRSARRRAWRRSSRSRAASRRSRSRRSRSWSPGRRRSGRGRRRARPRRPRARCRRPRPCRCGGSRRRARSRRPSVVSSGRLWKTPRPSAGIATPLLSFRVGVGRRGHRPGLLPVSRLSGAVGRWRAPARAAGRVPAEWPIRVRRCRR